MNSYYFDNKIELRTSYANQRHIAVRELGPETECIHGETVSNGCEICRRSGTPLVKVA